MKKSKNSLIRGAFSLGAGAFVAKLLGALYRVPLTNLIGGFGLGLYQMVFPVYALLLDFSGAGVPSALSKIISSGGEDDKHDRAHSYLISSIKTFLVFGIVGTLIMAVFAKPLARFQGNKDAFYGYLFLSPAILLVSIISCFRGYFQGLMSMTPTAVSQIIEQAVKLALGLFFVSLFVKNIPFAVAGATFAITLSELTALIYLYATYLKNKKKLSLKFAFNKNAFKSQSKTIIKTAVPITLIGIMIPLSQVVDSFLIVNVLGAYRTDATALYGLLSGVVSTVINLPVSICYGVAMVAIPAVSACKTETDKNKNAVRTLFLTAAFAIPCVIFLAIFSRFTVGLLFGGLSPMEKITATNLLKISAPTVLLLSVVQTSNAILIGKGKLYQPVISLGIGVAVKVVLNLLLLSIPEINIFGGAVAVIACYFTVCLINLIMIFKLKVKNESKRAYRRQYAS